MVKFMSYFCMGYLNLDMYLKQSWKCMLLLRDILPGNSTQICQLDMTFSYQGGAIFHEIILYIIIQNAISYKYHLLIHQLRNVCL